MKKLKIINPNRDTQTMPGTFRELTQLWKEKGLVDVEIGNTRNCWVGSVNNILLYDKPTLEWFNPNIDRYNFALFGNTVPDLPNSSPWIFWGRRPRFMEEIKKYRNNWNDRNIDSIFLGKVENNVQLNKRTSIDWSNSIELFEMPVNGEYKYTQKEYLELLTRSKYGLCLSGYGPKCNREIELMCMGVVPIITPLVDLTYYNSLVEGKHYIRVSNPSEIKDKIESIPESEWKEMSNNCIEWYEDNCSIQGSFNTTIEILEKNNMI